MYSSIHPLSVDLISQSNLRSSTKNLSIHRKIHSYPEVSGLLDSEVVLLVLLMLAWPVLAVAAHADAQQEANHHPDPDHRQNHRPGN